jgi:hypothetical protein
VIIMNLTDTELIQALLQSVRPARRTPRKAESQDAHEPKRAQLMRRCHCSTCSLCRETARWDRIFREKFADPHYYDPRIPRCGSSLNFSN